jgi:hypothetical protein
LWQLAPLPAAVRATAQGSKTMRQITIPVGRGACRAID